MTPHEIEWVRPSPAYGGALKPLFAGAGRVRELAEETVTLPSWNLTPRQVCDIELLLNGAYSPLGGFMEQGAYESVCANMRLADGTLWPMPITLDVSEQFAGSLSPGDRVALRHPEGRILAVLTVSDVWKPDFSAEARHVFGTEDDHHPGVFTLVRNSFPVYVGGRLEGMELPEHHTFGEFRHTPAELRVLFEQRGWNRVVAFQTRKPMHRAHVELTKRAMAAVGANLLIHAVVGLTRPGDVDCYTRVRCYKAAMAHYPSGAVALSLLPLAMRTGGPREAVWHAIIGKNYGCTHLIVGRNHAGPGPDRGGNPYYGPYDAQELLHKHQAELGIEAVPFRELLYSPSAKRYVTRSEVVNDEKTLSLSGTGLRERLNRGTEIPDWFSFPDVIGMLRKAYPPRAQQGFTVFFTGLPSSGKSTLANILMAKLMEIGTRPVTVLDGDVVRKHLSSELGFSREHRDLNIRRIGYVASEITKNRGVAICAPIAPYDATRREVRAMVSPYGGFIEVHVSTPIEVCESRDPKGLYAQARAGRIRNFTGIDDPYEVPNDAEVTVDNSTTTPEEGAVKVLSFLRAQGFVD